MIFLYVIQSHPCDTLEEVHQDESYAAYIMGNPIDCEEYQECKVVEVPQVIDRALGAGWLFPKRSPLQPLFDSYIKNIVEKGAFQRMVEFHSDIVIKKPICPDTDGDPIGVEKTFSLVTIMIAGVGLSIIFLM